MTELAFAKQFLSALDARPMRISPDHVVDPREYPAQPAVRGLEPQTKCPKH